MAGSYSFKGLKADDSYLLYNFENSDIVNSGEKISDRKFISQYKMTFQMGTPNVYVIR